MYDTTLEQFNTWLDALPEETIIGNWEIEDYRHPLDTFLETTFAPERFSVGNEFFCHLDKNLTQYPMPDWMKEINKIFAHTSGERGSWLVKKHAFIQKRARMEEERKRGTAALS